MQKVIVILSIVLLSSCGGMRRTGRVTGAGNFASESSIKESALSEVNLNQHNFFIQKADVEYSDGSTVFNVVATVKFVVPDKYLITLRLRSGIELGRIYATSDTILANDRINRKMYFGKPAVLSLRYGIPFDVLPVVFGDIVASNLGTTLFKCIENHTRYESQVKGTKLIYDIDCLNRKPVRLIQESHKGIATEFVYNDFRKSGDIIYPESISILHNQSGGEIRIKVDKITVPWEGSVEFIPGNNYEKVELR